MKVKLLFGVPCQRSFKKLLKLLKIYDNLGRKVYHQRRSIARLTYDATSKSSPSFMKQNSDSLAIQSARRCAQRNRLLGVSVNWKESIIATTRTMLKLLAGQILGAVGAVRLAFVVQIQNAFRVVPLWCTHFGTVYD